MIMVKKDKHSKIYYTNIFQSQFLKFQDKDKRASAQGEARRLSRDVWELLMVLPTNDSLFKGFMKISTDDVISIQVLFLTSYLSTINNHFIFKIDVTSN